MRSFHEIHRQHGDGGLTEGTQRRTLCLKVTQTAPFREVRPRAGVCGPRRKPPRSLPGGISGAFAQLGHFTQCPAAWRAVSPRLPCDCDVTHRRSLRDPRAAGRRARPGAAVPRPPHTRGVPQKCTFPSCRSIKPQLSFYQGDENVHFIGLRCEGHAPGPSREDPSSRIPPLVCRMRLCVTSRPQNASFRRMRFSLPAQTWRRLTEKRILARRTHGKAQSAMTLAAQSCKGAPRNAPPCCRKRKRCRPCRRWPDGGYGKAPASTSKSH